MGRLPHEAWGGHPIAAITLPGDRRDDLIAESAATVVPGRHGVAGRRQRGAGRDWSGIRSIKR